MQSSNRGTRIAVRSRNHLTGHAYVLHLCLRYAAFDKGFADSLQKVRHTRKILRERVVHVMRKPRTFFHDGAHLGAFPANGQVGTRPDHRKDQSNPRS